MLKVIIAIIVSAGVIYLGNEHGIMLWMGAAIVCAILESTLFNNIVLFIPAAVGGAGAFGQFFMNDAKTASFAAVAIGAVSLMLLYKEMTEDKKVVEEIKRDNMKKLRNY
jgi:membrane protein implicated in regulation of membrane protease activity